MLNVYNIETSNYVNGNGCRYVLWLQGCDLKCAGCWNKQTWSFKPNALKSVDEIFAQIKSLEHQLDGVTFSGGEPFLQAGELSQLAKLIKEKTHLDIQIFSGFSKEELKEQPRIELLKYTDILVAGRFDSSKFNNNQVVYLLNDNVDIWQFNNSDVEIEIDENMDIKVTGYPTNKLLAEIKEDTNERI
jgi:anaerobic ribonucleoside-triphosphate reductase activating protein